ncbi:MAG: ABC transporter permease [Spirochaetaceae bacterium]|nr:ABC transporter permease [Spirochaetaceae bacterium]
MRDSKYPLEKFEILSFLITSLVFLFFLTIISFIVVGGFSSISKVFFSKEIRFSIGLSLLTATISTLIAIVIAIFISFYLEKVKFIKSPIISTIIELPLSLPYLVIGLSLLLIFSSPLGKTLRNMGIPVIFSPIGIVVAQLTVNLPYAIKLIRSELTKLDSRLEFTASILGANRTQTFFAITLPQIRVSIIIAFALCWQRAIGEFGATLMLVGITAMKTETLPGAIYLNIATGDTDMALAAALIMLFFCLVTLLITTILQKKIKVKSRYD